MLPATLWYGFIESYGYKYYFPSFLLLMLMMKVI